MKLENHIKTLKFCSVSNFTISRYLDLTPSKYSAMIF
nr:MAG TPA: hypothetical protein [Caudoviricetes sp.]